jgi:hypothetical protein
MSGLVNNFNTAVGAVGNVGNAASVAADQMPVFNNTAASGVNSFNDQAGAMNNTAASGVNSFNDQAGAMNNTAAQGVSTFNNQAGAFNNTAASGVNSFNDQAGTFNNTAAQGVDDINHQAEILNNTVAQGVASVKDVIGPLADPLALLLGIMGPLQLLMMVKVGIDIVQKLKDLRNPPPHAAVPEHFLKLSAAINAQTAAIYNQTDAHYEINTAQMVQNLMGNLQQPFRFNERTNELTAYFFYTKSKRNKVELTGLKYFAFDSVLDMFQAILAWNYIAAASKNRPRVSYIYFLDHNPPPMALPNYDFTGHYQNVRIISLAINKCIQFDSMKIGNGCSVRIENLTVCTLGADVSSGGSLYLHQCNVDYIPALTQTLFGITWQECSLGQDGKLAYEDASGWGAYDGEVDQKSRERIGNGKMTYATGYYYEGGFVNNKREGSKCFYRWPNGDEYMGGFKDGVFHGVGIIRSKARGFVEYRTSEMALIVDRLQWSADGKKANQITLSQKGMLALAEMRLNGRKALSTINNIDELHKTWTEISLDEAKRLAKKVYKLPVPEHVKGKDELNLSKVATATAGYTVGTAVVASMAVGCVVM